MVARYKWESDEVKTYIGYNLRYCFLVGGLCLYEKRVHSQYNI